jgi:hypothetical protein
MTALVLAAVALWIEGAPGAPVLGVALAGAEAAPVPTAFVALTVQEYVTPLVSPPTVTGLAALLAVCEAAPDTQVAP